MWYSGRSVRIIQQAMEQQLMPIYEPELNILKRGKLLTEQNERPPFTDSYESCRKHFDIHREWCQLTD